MTRHVPSRLRLLVLLLGLTLVIGSGTPQTTVGAAGTPVASPAASQTILLTGQLQHPGPVSVAQLQQLALAPALYDGKQADIATICRTLGISRATLYRALARAPDRPGASTNRDHAR